MIWNAQSRSQTTCPDSKKGGLKTEKNKGNEFAATKVRYLAKVELNNACHDRVSNYIDSKR